MKTYNPFNLEGKKILVTGSSSGIGRSVAVECSHMGATLFLNGRNEKRLKETMVALSPGNHQILAGDIVHGDDIKKLVSALSPLDGIVHCAGVGQRILCKNLQENDIDDVMHANFKGPVMLQTEILKQRKINPKASIVFVSSIAAESSSVGNAIYSASKGAITSYANCLALELAPRKIRVNCIKPAMVWTDLILKGGITEEELREDEKKYPLKRYGIPEDIAYLAVYLLSDASTWMTNTSVKITGGL